MNTQDFYNFNLKRSKMVEEQLASNGIVQKELLNAFLTVPRHEFVPDEFKDKSYNNSPLPIGYSQTISQPFVVAFMLQVLNLVRGQKVLEIGTGSGYQTALLCELGCEVFTV
ncbi:MAG: protein-L-isoaspartate O-methyltransferase family protein, partial [Thermodesulfobacteriota bacterium]